MARRYTESDLRTLATEGLGAGLPAPRRYRNEESIIQRNFIRWWDQHAHEFGVPNFLLMSIPNGGKRDKVTACLLKLEGCRSGAPDLLLAVPREDRYYGVHRGGLFIEMKTETGLLRNDQRKFLKALQDQNYLTAVCRSFEDAKTVITEYLTCPSP